MITISPIGVDEATGTLTGYEENDVEARFGVDPMTLLETKPIMAMRALAYVMVVRDLVAQDVKDPKGKAFKHVMELSVTQIGDFFPDEADEPLPEEPETTAGEGDSSAG
jgi:hypothetical protein